MNSKEPLKLKNKNEKRFSAKHLKRCGTLIFELIGDSKKKAFRSIQTRALSSMIKPFKLTINSFILVLLLVEISADVYKKLAETDISGIEIGSTVYKINSPVGCLIECNKQVKCNIVTHTLPDRCDLYYVLQEIIVNQLI